MSDTEANLAAFAAESAGQRASIDWQQERIREMEGELEEARDALQRESRAYEDAACRTENAEHRLAELQQRYDQLRSCLIRIEVRAGDGQYVVPNLHHWRHRSGPLEERFNTWSQAEAYLDHHVLVELEHQAQLSPAPPRSTL